MGEIDAIAKIMMKLYKIPPSVELTKDNINEFLTKDESDYYFNYLYSTRGIYE